MVYLRDIKHIFFDLDDTLWDFESNSRSVLEELFKEFGLAAKLKTDFHTFHTAYKKVNAGLWSDYYQKRLTKEELRDKRFDCTFRDFGYEAYRESINVSELYLQRSPHGKRLKANCLDVLQYLSAGGYELHVITNGFKEVQQVKMNSSGLNPYFRTVIISEEHGYIKPDPAIFRIAERLSGARTSECLIIGDNLESDIAGGEGAGWKTIYFNDTDKKHRHHGLSVMDLIELKTIL